MSVRRLVRADLGQDSVKYDMQEGPLPLDVHQYRSRTNWKSGAEDWVSGANESVRCREFDRETVSCARRSVAFMRAARQQKSKESATDTPLRFDKADKKKEKEYATGWFVLYKFGRRCHGPSRPVCECCDHDGAGWDRRDCRCSALRPTPGFWTALAFSSWQGACCPRRRLTPHKRHSQTHATQLRGRSAIRGSELPCTHDEQPSRLQPPHRSDRLLVHHSPCGHVRARLHVRLCVEPHRTACLCSGTSDSRRSAKFFATRNGGCSKRGATSS
jgi:hypothetical protein